jgi:hypothetical protein
VPVIATGLLFTVIFAVLAVDNDLEQVVFSGLNAVTVMIDGPAAVSPDAMNVPEPAVETVIVAVNPVCEGEEVL